jgi:hypothetical protein
MDRLEEHNLGPDIGNAGCGMPAMICTGIGGSSERPKNRPWHLPTVIRASRIHTATDKIRQPSLYQ